MSDTKKATLAQQKIASTARKILHSPTITFGLPAGVSVQTNSAQVTRFPLPLTLGAAVFAAIGVIAAARGHRVVGFGLVGLGVVGLGAAAAAPELNAGLAKVQGAL